MLTEARRSAEEADVLVEWVHADATEFRSKKLYDAAICLCERASALLSIDDDDIPVGEAGN
jgi:hypothetical protein